MLGYRNNRLSQYSLTLRLIMTTNAQHYTINEGSFLLPNNWQDESSMFFLQQPFRWKSCYQQNPYY